MVKLWSRRIEKKYDESVEAGNAELLLCPECYYAEVVADLISKGIIEEDPHHRG